MSPARSNQEPKAAIEKYNCKPGMKVAITAMLSIGFRPACHGATIPLPSFTVKMRSTAGIVISSFAPLGQ